MQPWEQNLTTLSDEKLLQVYLSIRREMQMRKDYRITHQAEMMLRSQVARAEIEYLEHILLLPDKRP